ncbi:hypothetical protein TREES_T100009128 [Tupaia chinensis]|uniref:Uncharacterized protein n=1 Tax=Tupaia chinensis TaxID=246437 RepID=L9KQB3_TUPCH|nr:hypothetical protein TREES_T100009128 [Tupaia chinensis]
MLEDDEARLETEPGDHTGLGSLGVEDGQGCQVAVMPSLRTCGQQRFRCGSFAWRRAAAHPPHSTRPAALYFLGIGDCIQGACVSMAQDNAVSAVGRVQVETDLRYPREAPTHGGRHAVGKWEERRFLRWSGQDQGGWDESWLCICKQVWARCPPERAGAVSSVASGLRGRQRSLTGRGAPEDVRSGRSHRFVCSCGHSMARAAVSAGARL